MTKKVKKSSYEDLIEEALSNASDDRDRAIEAFEMTKGIFRIDLEDPKSMQGLMLVGQNIPKLLEIAHKSNEQIIKLAQLREKEKDRESKKEEAVSGPITIKDIQQYVKDKSGNE